MPTSINVPAANPAGSSTQVQYNASGAFGAISGMTSDGTNVTSMSVKAPVLMLGATSGTLTWSVPATVTSHTLILPAAIGIAAQALTISNASTGQLAWTDVTLTGITTSLNTSSPNVTLNSSRILASGGTTNQDLVLSVKGNGALLANLPDSTSTGGNKRGSYAVDLQMIRGSAAQVAGGTCSVTLGQRNTASGDTAVAMGYNNAASGSYSCAAGGQSNTASGTQSTVLGGLASAASGDNSWVLGGNTVISSNYGQGSWGGAGDGSQTSVMTVSNVTANATPTELFSAGNGSTNRMVIPSGRVWVFTMLIAGNDDANSQWAGYEVKGVISNRSGTVALVGAITKTVLAEVNAAWDVDVVADTTNDALVVNVTGQASRNIKWAASVTVCEIG